LIKLQWKIKGRGWKDPLRNFCCFFPSTRSTLNPQNKRKGRKVSVFLVLVGPATQRPQSTRTHQTKVQYNKYRARSTRVHFDSNLTAGSKTKGCSCLYLPVISSLPHSRTTKRTNNSIKTTQAIKHSSRNLQSVLPIHLVRYLLKLRNNKKIPTSKRKLILPWLRYNIDKLF
jgi:hypothetical protein